MAKKRGAMKIIALVISVFFGLTIATVLFCISTRPSWRLSAHNSATGVVVEIYKENKAEPTYSTLLEGHSIDREVERIARENLPKEVGETIFFDNTLRPGRWTLLIDGVKLDIMERTLILDDGVEIHPHE